MVWSLNQRWIQSTLNDQLFASSRWNANMISSFFGSRRFGSIVLAFGMNWLFRLPSSFASTMPLPFRSPFQAYTTGMFVVSTSLWLLLLNSFRYILLSYR